MSIAAIIHYNAVTYALIFFFTRNKVFQSLLELLSILFDATLGTMEARHLSASVMRILCVKTVMGRAEK